MMASSFAFLCLRVKKEVDEVIGMKNEISYDDLGQLVYLSQVCMLKLRRVHLQSEAQHDSRLLHSLTL